MQPMKTINLHPTNDDTIKLLALSDICLYGLLEANCNQNWFEKLFTKEILKIVHDKDISIANLECPITTKSNKIKKSGLFFSAPVKSIIGLEKLKIDIGVLANNHILDYGVEGMNETISLCEKAGIKSVGVGRNVADATQPLVVNLKGSNLAFLAFTEEEFSCANETTSGAAPLNLALAGKAILNAKRNNDIVIVSVHGGNEFYPIPSPRMQMWYRFLVDCGANVIIGHHPHAVQGIEIYKDVPIIYSLGSFLFQEAAGMPKCYNQSIITKLILSNNKVATIEIYPVEQMVSSNSDELINGVKLELLADESRKTFYNKFSRLCQIVNDPILLQNFWYSFCFSRRSDYYNSLKTNSTSINVNYFKLLKYIIKKRKFNYLISIWGDILNFLLQKKGKRLQSIAELKNLLVCPAHYDVLVTLLEMQRLNIKPPSEIDEELFEIMKDCI